jgi:hypothetical protein
LKAATKVRVLLPEQTTVAPSLISEKLIVDVKVAVANMRTAFALEADLVMALR